MAEKFINDNIEFAYSTNKAIIELKKEIEKYFLYQKILIVDHNYEYGKVIEEMEQQIRCDFCVSHDILALDNFEEFALIISINISQLQSIKALAMSKKIPYIVILTKAERTAFACKQIINLKYNIISVNSPLGIVLDKSQIQQKKIFISKILMELNQSYNEFIQQKICNIFYSEKMNFDLNNSKLSIADSAFKLFSLQNRNYDEFFDELCEKYLTYCIKKSESELSLIDKLTYLLLVDHQQYSRSQIEIDFLFNLILSKFETDFFSFFNLCYMGTIDYEAHQKELFKIGQKYKLKECLLPENKIQFLLCEFRRKLSSYVIIMNEANEKIKNILADIDLNYLFGIFNSDFIMFLKKYLSLEPDLFIEPSFLSLAKQCGLLNYNL